MAVRDDARTAHGPSVAAFPALLKHLVVKNDIEWARRNCHRQGVKNLLILVVDDDEDICSTISAVFQDSGLDTLTATSGFDALQMIATNNVTVVISDVRMANGNGLELLAAVRKHYPRLPVFLITGYDDMTSEDALRQGARELFNKPFDIRRLISTVKTTISNNALVI